MVAVEPAFVWADGSCMFMDGMRTAGKLGAGGWAAVIERGSVGYVRRGREAETTSTNMELVAVIEALASLPDGVPTTVVTDSTALLVVKDKWERGELPARVTRPHIALVLDVAGQLDRMPVTFRLLEKNQRDHRHRRCHLLARAEAMALRDGLEQPPVPGMQWKRKGGWWLPANVAALAE